MKRRFSRTSWSFVALAAVVAVLMPTARTTSARAESGDIRTVLFKGLPIQEFLSDGGMAALFGPDTSSQTYQPGRQANGRTADAFVNDPCLDPSPPGLDGTVQSEPEIAVLNASSSMGKKMVAGYNDTAGFNDRNSGLSGFSYSTDGGATWIDGGGLTPAVAGPGTSDDDGKDAYFGDPSLVVHQATQRFFYASIYKLPDGSYTVSVNRGIFRTAPAQGQESVANTRCLNDPTQTGVSDPPQASQERMVWEPPVAAVRPTAEVGGALLNVDKSPDFLDKPWLSVDQTTGTLYLTYTRFALDGETPVELARCMGCAYKAGFTSADWDGPYTIVPNEADTANQGAIAVTTARPGATGGPSRLIATWFARTFYLAAAGTSGLPGANSTETKQRIGYAYSDDDGRTWSGDKTIAVVNPQREPLDYNRGRSSGIANVPAIAVDKGADDGVFTSSERSRSGFGNVYVTYFSGKSPLPNRSQAADTFVSRSTDNGTTFQAPVKANDDPGTTSHVFPTVQVNKNGSVYAGWLDRRNDPNNVLTGTWASVSKNNGVTFGPNRVQSDVATSWGVRSDARPNFGDYISSDLIGFSTFAIIFADGRFRPPGGQAATPDTLFTITSGLGQ
jgi:hypothetical protein